jgi:FlaA1/EpsC-like NDP-sugar epimerase
MLIDAIVVILSLYCTVLIRPSLSTWLFMAPPGGPASIPFALYILFPACWVAFFTPFALYDGNKHIRAVDEFAILSLSSVLAATSLAGILYLSFRQFPPAQYLLFVVISYLGFVIWRAIARFVFRLERQSPQAVVRRVIIAGTGSVARKVEDRLINAQEYDLALAGFVDDTPVEDFAGTLVGEFSDLRNCVEQLAITDVIIALPPHCYEQMRVVVSSLNEVPVRVWIAPGDFDLALGRTAQKIL